MGIIDATRYRVTCPKCGAVETPAAHQTGSAYSAGPWRPPEAKAFKLSIEYDAYGEPEIKRALCLCGADAEVVVTGTGP